MARFDASANTPERLRRQLQDLGQNGVYNIGDGLILNDDTVILMVNLDPNGGLQFITGLLGIKLNTTVLNLGSSGLGTPFFTSSGTALTISGDAVNIIGTGTTHVNGIVIQGGGADGVLVTSSGGSAVTVTAPGGSLLMNGDSADVNGNIAASLIAFSGPVNVKSLGAGVEIESTTTTSVLAGTNMTLTCTAGSMTLSPSGAINANAGTNFNASASSDVTFFAVNGNVLFDTTGGGTQTLLSAGDILLNSTGANINLTTDSADILVSSAGSFGVSSAAFGLFGASPISQVGTYTITAAPAVSTALNCDGNGGAYTSTPLSLLNAATLTDLNDLRADVVSLCAVVRQLLKHIGDTSGYGLVNETGY